MGGLAVDQIESENSGYRDELPEDLDATLAVVPYSFPSTSRRRIISVMCFVTAVICFGLYAASGNSVLVNDGIRNLGIALVALAIYFWLSGWQMKPTERDALATATNQVEFPIGHASAQLGWTGLLSKPVWRILLYSDENPPLHRGVVLIDAVSGETIFSDSEENPENWAQMAGSQA